MKRSAVVTLVISGALLAGCDDKPAYNQSAYNSGDWSSNTNSAITNNTYVAGQGYWHAPYHAWYPYPYNYFRPGFGYYYGGRYYDHPDLNPIGASTPRSFTSSGTRVGSGYTGAGSSESSSGGSHSSVARGGFGGSAHSSGS